MKLQGRKMVGVAAAGVVLASGVTALTGSAAHADGFRSGGHAPKTAYVNAKGAASPSTQQLYSAYVWASNVNVRTGRRDSCDSFPSVAGCPTIVRKVSRQEIGVYCQKKGQPVRDSGYYSEWWSYVSNPYAPSGYLSNVYIRGKAKLDGIPVCTW